MHFEFTESHPSWVCGLKHIINIKSTRTEVTPFVGVWIETSCHLPSHEPCLSHPSWVCGLKLAEKKSKLKKQKSHPSWVCGLKPLSAFIVDADAQSHPSWVCGLKHP